MLAAMGSELTELGHRWQGARPWFLFAHGAGAGSSSTWIRRYAALLETIAPVITFDYLYIRQGRKRPDTLSSLIACHTHALEEGREKYGARPVLIGKSMGGRVGCHVALVQPVEAVICLGYPLLGQGQLKKRRDQVLLDLTNPALFVQGTRDKLCPIPELRQVLAARSARSELHIVESGDHSLTPTKGYLKENGLNDASVEQMTLAVIERFLKSLEAPSAN